MKKEISHLNNFSFFLKTPRELSEKEKEEMHDKFVRLYPPFKSFYDKNRYYSTIKPQIIYLVKEEDKLAGSAKLLWHNIKVNNETIKFFAFGMLIDDSYQKQGIGTRLVRLEKKEAKERKAGLLYAASKNPHVEKMLEKAGFKKLKTIVKYKDSITKEIKKESNFIYVFEFKKGLINKINKLEQFYIGIGPI
jgi:GNAT superfamily N-acetyltransferase